MTKSHGTHNYNITGCLIYIKPIQFTEIAIGLRINYILLKKLVKMMQNRKFII